jgi:hypothetical protein
MSYDQTRDAEQLRVLDPSIDEFINRYNNSNGPVTGSPRQTVFLFPGGMASSLKRATQPYLDSGPAGQMFSYDPIWLTFGDFFGDVLKLRIHKNGEYRDENNQIIVADGTLNFFGWTFYLGFTKMCELLGLDYYVFGWDWRRRLQDSGEFFITQFLPYFQQRVQNGCNNADPLTSYSLVGHSAGGMVINWILRETDTYPILGTLQKVITVATPFYGYAGQVHRFFEGDVDFNWDPLISKDDLIKVICSLPACYAWLFMDYSTWIANKNAFQTQDDVPYQLTAYPSLDTNLTDPADPYNPQMLGYKGRYRTDTGFDMGELYDGEQLVNHLASSLDSHLAAKFFNIRGDDQKNDTVGNETWGFVPPTQPSPIHDGSNLAGDDTQPAWSARHLDLLALPGHVITVKGATVSHMMTMFSPDTLLELAGLLLEVLPVMAMEHLESEPWWGLRPEIATPKETADFLQSLRSQFRTRLRTKTDRIHLRKALAHYKKDDLQRLLRRVVVNLVQHRGPGPKREE